ncbi:tyrosinase family protein [Saccharothrix sp. HUAS TT1]|uniref:tyrosinase family protein n=1 Tax=unclassified Saccharothrix TaxID=2593673 RepID=UPI00345B58D2
MKWRINVSATSSTALRRAMALRGSLPTVSDVDTAAGVSTYDVPPWGSASSGGVRDRAGGHVARVDSPNDPVFFLHHCNVDRVWSRRQARWGFGTAQHLPGGGVADVVDVDEALRPFGVAVAATLDHRGACTYG